MFQLPCDPVHPRVPEHEPRPKAGGVPAGPIGYHARFMYVDCCICHRRTFDELLALATARGWSFEELREAGMCSTRCALCEPYVRLTLHTGRTRFPLLSPEQSARMLAENGLPGS